MWNTSVTASASDLNVLRARGSADPEITSSALIVPLVEIRTDLQLTYLSQATVLWKNRDDYWQKTSYARKRAR